MPNYYDYQNMNAWGQQPNMQTQQPPMFGGTSWTPPSDFSFGKRSDALSAGVPTSSDYFTGAGQAFKNGDLMGSLKDFGSGIGDSLGGKDFWMGGKDANGMQTMGAASVGLDLFNALSSYMGARKTEKLGRAQLGENQRQFGLNFNNASAMADDARLGRHNRDIAEAKLNNKAMPGEFKPLSRA